MTHPREDLPAAIENSGGRPPGGFAAWLKPNDSALPAQPNIDFASAVTLGVRMLVVGLGGFLLWATIAPIDEGVPTQGVLSVDSTRKRIDHLAGGIVEKISVRDGQRVNAGDELIILNETQTKAALNATLGQWRTATATRARLQAERDGLRSVMFPKALADEMANADVLAVMRSQEDFFRSRRASLEGELRIIRESAKGFEDQLASLEQLRSGREKQVQLFNAQLASFRELNRKGFVSQNQLLELERQLSEIQAKQSEDLANMGGIKARLAEFRMRDGQRMVDYRREVESQLADVDRELATLTERLGAVRDTYARLVIRAPVSGTVVDLAAHTIGGVVKPGDRIMDLVPDNDELVVVAQLPPHYVDRVHAGLPAAVHFDSYASFARRPVVAGKVTTVSADVLTDARTGSMYYALRVAVPVSEIVRLKEVKLVPGMQATVMVKTGERTFMAYLLRPLLRRFTSALSEA